MLKVGLTGNIGSGKTVVAQLFSKLGVPVFHADNEARKLFDQKDIKESILKIFGRSVFSDSGEINRSALAEIVFTKENLLEKLNNIIHPVVKQHYKEWCQQFVSVPYTLYEAAILFESGHYKEMDRIICVAAPEELRISRVMARDALTRQEVEKRIANQWSEDRKTALSDFIINNDGSKMIIEQVIAIHNILTQNSKLKTQN